MKKKKQRTEDILHKNFATMIRQYEGFKKLNCVWWGYNGAGEKRSLITASLLKAKGLQAGEADYQFLVKKQIGYLQATNKELMPPLYEMHYVYLEFKKLKTLASPQGTQSERQKKFEAIFEGCSNAKYYLVYSIEEAIKILERNKIILS